MKFRYFTILALLVLASFTLADEATETSTTSFTMGEEQPADAPEPVEKIETPQSPETIESPQRAETSQEEAPEQKEKTEEDLIAEERMQSILFQQYSPETQVHWPINLTDSNFEHLTQAATGATTGDWYVEFYAPWCSACKDFEYAWNWVADKMSDRINIARVNIDEAPLTMERFNITEIPTIILLKRGKFYKYHSHYRPVDLLEKFAMKIYNESDTQGDVPPPPTFVDHAKLQLGYLYIEILLRFETVFKWLHLSEASKGAKIAISAITISIVFLLAYLVLCRCRKGEKVKQETEENNQGEESKKPSSRKKKID